MQRLAFGAAAAGGAAFALHHLAPKVREMHTQCHKMMRTHCGNASAPCRP
jgi:hypothetical protein